jgi:hypothetical protein
VGAPFQLPLGLEVGAPFQLPQGWRRGHHHYYTSTSNTRVLETVKFANTLVSFRNKFILPFFITRLFLAQLFEFLSENYVNKK